MSLDAESPRNPSTFHKFYQEHRPWSRSVLRRALADTGMDWEEHWNQAWAKFSRNYLDAAFTFRTSPEAYLRRILANQIIDALRQHARELSPLLLGEHDESLEDASTTGHGTLDLLDGHALAELSPADWQDPALAAAIAKLSPMQRSVIMFWAWRQPPPTDTEIGGEFGISTSAAKTHRSRALDRLRTMLDVAGWTPGCGRGDHMKHPSGPSDGELHARLNAFLQADAEAETADEDTIRDEVQQLTGHLPAKASDEPARAAGQHTTDHRRMSTGNRVRRGSLWSILEPVLLVIAGSSLAVSLVAARATTLISVVAAAVATATVLALVYVRTASHGWKTSQAHADLLIRQWEREDRRQVMTWERQDRLRDLAYAREDALRRALWERQDLELARARENALRREELEDFRRRWTWEREKPSP